MNNITAARDISGIAPVSVLRGISPLCVPFASGSGLADEVKRRADPNIVSLWERLGLVYLIEQPAQAPVHKTHVTVNNFTAQLVFRICSQNHTDRLIERYQPGFVFPEKIRAAGAALNSVLRTNEAHRVGEAFTRNSRYTEEISRIFRLVFEKETGGIPLQTVCRALAVLLGSTGGGAVFTAQQQKIFQRIATVLSAEYPESTAAQEIASVGAAAVFTEEQRRRILSAANVMGYNTQHEAAQRVLSLVNSGKTREEIGRVLLTEVRRYGLDGEMQNDVITSARAAVSSSQPESGVITAETESPTEQGNGFVIPVNGVSYEMAKLLLADDFSGDIPSGAISSAAIAESSAAKVLAERLSTVKYDERFNKAFSEEITERLTKFVTGHIAGNSAPSTLTGGIAGSHQLSGTVVSLPSVSGEKLVSVTAGTSGRILNQLGSQETQLNLISHNSAESSQFSENVRNTLEIIKQYSGNQVSEDQSNIYDNADNSDFGVNVSVVQQFSDDRSYSSHGTTEQYLDIQQTEHVDGKRGSAAVPADIHDTQTVLPAERATEIHSAEQFHTESTTEVPKPGTVLPTERTTEIHSAEQYHTDTVFTPKSEAQAAAGSFRSRLDTRTLETLDRLVAESRGQVKVPDEPQEQPAQMVLAQNEPQHSATAELSGSEVLRSVNIVRRSIVNETTTHIQRLMEKAAAPVVQPTVQKPFKYRTVGGAENMVMLVPPSEMDRFRAADPYMSKLPPIELKEPQKPQPEQEGTTRKTTVNNRPVIVRSTDSSIDSLSREDLSRLADKVYERIETKLTRERRRMGL